MRQAPTQSRTARPGFTLIELLVVMAIIAILVGLALAGFGRVRIKAYEVSTRSEISQLATSIQGFQVKYGVDHVPSAIILREDGRYGDNPTPALRQLELETENYLKKVFPQMNVAAKTGNPAPNSRTALPAALALDWNGDGTYQRNQFFILEGDQCLVFFLGGIQRNGSCMGFSVVRSNPTTPTGQMDPPMYDFQTARLAVWNAGVGNRSQYFRSYLDPYGTPFAYFSGRGGVGFSSDCPNLQSNPTILRPYYEVTSNKYYNKDGFQIISAGYDKKFGPGHDTWDARVGYDSPPGEDDLTNFHPVVMGAKL